MTRKGLDLLMAVTLGSLPLACQRDADFNLQKYLSAGPTGTAIVAYPTGTQTVGDTPKPPESVTNLRDKLTNSGMTTYVRSIPDGQFLRGLLLDHNTEPSLESLSIFYVDPDGTLQSNERNGLEKVANTYSKNGTNTTVYNLTPAKGGFSRFENLLQRKGYRGGD